MAGADEPLDVGLDLDQLEIDPDDQKEPGPGSDELYCPECDAGPFKGPRGLKKHLTEIHEGGTGRHSRGEPSQKAERQRQKGYRVQPKTKTSRSVQMAMFLSYRLAGAAFASWGPEPVQVRQTVGGSMIMTAGPAAQGMDRVARRTPFYPILEMICSATGVVDDLMPLGIPLVLGMYGYSPPQARRRMRPLMGQALTMMFGSLFGVEMPVEEQAQAVTEGIDQTPQGMQQLAEAFLQGMEMSPDGAAAPEAA